MPNQSHNLDVLADDISAVIMESPRLLSAVGNNMQSKFDQARGNMTSGIVKVNAENNYEVVSQSPGTSISATDYQAKSIDFTIRDPFAIKLKANDIELIKNGGTDAYASVARDIGNAFIRKFESEFYAESLKFSQVVDAIGTNTREFFTKGTQILSEKGVDMSNIQYSMAPSLYTQILNDTSMSNVNTSGDMAAMRDGKLVDKFGTFIINNQHSTRITSGTVVSTGTDVAGAVSGSYAADSFTLGITSLSGTQTLKVGDTFTIAGHSIDYTVTADVTLTSGAATISIFPGLESAVTTSDTVAFTDGTAATNNASSYMNNFMFAPDAFGLAYVPLEDVSEYGVKTAFANIGGLPLRMREWYDNNTGEHNIQADVAIALGIMDNRKAVRVRSA